MRAPIMIVGSLAGAMTVAASGGAAANSLRTWPGALEEERAFAEWAAVPLSVARYHIRGPNRHVSERPTIGEMLALRRAAQRVVELTEMLLLSIVPITGGRIGPLKFALIMAGAQCKTVSWSTWRSAPFAQDKGSVYK